MRRHERVRFPRGGGVALFDCEQSPIDYSTADHTEMVLSPGQTPPAPRAEDRRAAPGYRFVVTTTSFGAKRPIK